MISVLMGVYNGSDTVERAVRSILDGDYKELEFIAVDDGSSDNSLEILQKIALEDDRLKVYSYGGNKGLTYALNFAFSKSIGNFVARMDADDVSRKNRLVSQISYMKANPQISFCGTGARLVDETGEVWGVRQYPEVVDKKLLCKYSPFIHPTLLFRREALEAVGGYRDIQRTVRCEDYDLFFRLYAQNYVGQNIQDTLLDYFESRQSAGRHNKRTRKNEYLVRKEGVKAVKGGLIGRVYCLKPLLLSLLSDKIYNRLHNKKWKKK